MLILVNGQWQQEAGAMTLADLLDKLSLQPRRVAVELNRQIVPRAQYAQTQLGEGDELEIVTLVGGG